MTDDGSFQPIDYLKDVEYKSFSTRGKSREQIREELAEALRKENKLLMQDLEDALITKSDEMRAKASCAAALQELERIKKARQASQEKE